MRRLPIYFVLDCSESMAGDKLKKVESGVSLIIQQLKKDPQALETVYFSIITFAGISRTLSPLIEISYFYPPKLPLGGGTSLGLALNNLMKDIDTNTIKSTVDKKGDWKPIVYLWTDGRPTDNVDEAIKKWGISYASKVNLIAIGMGNQPDLAVLKKLTENHITYEGYGVGEDPTWEPELSMLTIGISMEDASVLGKKFEQNAIVYGEINNTPRLLILNEELK